MGEILQIFAKNKSMIKLTKKKKINNFQVNFLFKFRHNNFSEIKNKLTISSFKQNLVRSDKKFSKK